MVALGPSGAATAMASRSSGDRPRRRSSRQRAGAGGLRVLRGCGDQRGMPRRGTVLGDRDNEFGKPAAIGTIAEDAWIPARYPEVAEDPDTPEKPGELISDAETAYTAFASRKH
ncbi:hypothetical protein [Saccharopolyspora sp. NPDC002376]